MEKGEVQHFWTMQIHQDKLRADIHQVCRSVQVNQIGSCSVAKFLFLKFKHKNEN